MGCDADVVLGHPSHYPSFEFRWASDFGLGNDYGVGDAFMVVELRELGLLGRSGLGRHSPVSSNPR